MDSLEGQAGMVELAHQVDWQGNNGKWGWRVEARLEPDELGRLQPEEQAGLEPETILRWPEDKLFREVIEPQPVVDVMELVRIDQPRQIVKWNTLTGLASPIDDPAALRPVTKKTREHAQVRSETLVIRKIELNGDSFVRHGIPLHESARPGSRAHVVSDSHYGGVACYFRPLVHGYRTIQVLAKTLWP